MMSLEDELTQAMVDGYQRTGEEIGYWGKRFLQAVRREGGLKTAKRMLEPRTRGQRKGLDALLKVGRPDLTTEAVILQPAFKSLFNSAELTEAARRLRQYGAEARRHRKHRQENHGTELKSRRKSRKAAKKQVTAFITSRNFVLPVAKRDLQNGRWFNLWSRKLWPYLELAKGDTLFWYESRTGKIVWRTKVVDVARFRYAHKNEVGTRLHLRPAEIAQFYFFNAPNSGFCLAYRVEPIERVSLRKPDNFRFPHQGWLRVTPNFATIWPGFPVESESTPGDNLTAEDTAAIEGVGTETIAYSRGRSRALRGLAMANSKGICEVCRSDFSKLLNGKGIRALQVHHRKQLSAFNAPRLTRLSDLAVVCANCHCLIHMNPRRAIAVDRLRRQLQESY